MLQKLLENIDVLIESNDRWCIERDDIRRRIGIILDEIKESGYKCKICGFVYKGDITKEKDDYICPVCKQPKSVFEKI